MEKRSKVLAIASAGGHWQQLLRIRPAFDGMNVVFSTTQKGRERDIIGFPCHFVTDANQCEKIKIILLFIQILFIFLFFDS